MAIPIINPTTSILEAKQWQTWSFQPAALPSATYWNASGTPAGMTFDTGTGLLTGAAELPGVYNMSIRAGNSDGVSDPLIVAIGIEASSYLSPSGERDVWIDLQTGLVGISDKPTPVKADNALFSVKSNDDLFLRVRFIKGGVVADLDLDELNLTLKEDDSEAVLVTSGTFEKDGTGESASYLIRATLTGTALDGALSNYELAPPDFTKFNALAEISWVLPATLGAATAVASTQNFRIEIARELLEN